MHPVLAAILAEWRLTGFPRMVGRPPRPDDWIVPSREGRCRSVRHGHRKMQEDLERLGLRGRRQHDTRRTMITLARSDGAPDPVLRAITHGPPSDVISAYTSWPWPTLCAAISCLRVQRRAGILVPLVPEEEVHNQVHTPQKKKPNDAESLGFKSGVDGTRSGAPQETFGESGEPSGLRGTALGPGNALERTGAMQSVTHVTELAARIAALAPAALARVLAALEREER